MKADGIIRIRGDESADKHEFGGKGLRLRHLAERGIEVPDGLLLSREYLSSRMDEYVSQERLRKIIASEEKGEKGLDSLAMELFETSGAFAKLSHEIENCLTNIRGFTADTLFAVRSAALGEDDVKSSHAGQFETILNVKAADIGREVFACLASWWSDRATSYRRSMALAAEAPRMSIIVQRMVAADSAGVLFTRHPFDTEKDAMLVEAVSGLGEKLVSGKVTPSSWEIDRRTGTVIAKRGAGEKHGGKLDESSLSKLFSTALKIEKELGEGQDIEWAMEKDRLFVLQARPITTRPGKKETPNSREKPESHPFDIQNTYSRAVVEDLWADRMSNLTSSIVFDEFSRLFTFKEPLKRLGLKRLANAEAVKVVGGYGYVSCRAAAMALEYVPDAFRSREIEKMFPASFREKVLNIPARAKKIAAAALRAPRLLRDPAQLPFLTDILLRKFLKRVEKRLGEVSVESYRRMDLRELGVELERLLSIQGELQAKNQWGYGKAALYTWLLRQFASKLGKDGAWALGKMTRIPDNVTLRFQRDFDEIAELCDESVRATAFGDKDNRNAYVTLISEFADHPATRAFHRFINNYRYRSGNRDFINPRWDEIPETVAGMVARRLERSGGDIALSRRSQKGRTGEVRENERTLADFLLEPLVRGARRYLALREELRWGLDKIFYRIRKLILEISGRREFAIYRDTPDAVFFLELNELRRILVGKASPDRFFDEVERRRRAYTEEKDIAPSYYVVVDPVTEKAYPLKEDVSGETLAGIGASPGIAEGIARRIGGPEEFHLFRQGEILIAGNTDPGWTPLFVSASAVVTEMGGILNHCAIVAREYRVPAVVGVEGVTGRITTGMRVEVDGSAGFVRILDR